jgi:drug/metabolite transporter (DMT)-like permease
LLRLVLALTGVVVVLKTPGSAWPVPESLADWLALMGGFSFALTNILLRKLSKAPQGASMLAMFSGGALMSTGAAFVAMSAGLATLPPAPSLSWVGLAAVLSLAFLAGNVALQYGATHLSASATSLIMLLEVVFASGSAVLLGGGTLSTRTLLGGALILTASLLSALPTGKPPD